MSKGTPIKTIRLEPELLAELKRIAAEENVSVADVIRYAILDYLDKRKTACI